MKRLAKEYVDQRDGNYYVHAFRRGEMRARDELQADRPS